MGLETDRRDVEKALGIEGGLSGWDMDFLENIAESVEGGRELSEKQRGVLDRILERAGL